jgi:hypothetical protein
MTLAAKPLRAQFTLRSLLIALFWVALLLAICVQYQRAAARQREIIEHLKARGALPQTVVQGQPVTPASP